MDASVFPAISANTLFHFTGSIENLFDILTNEFRPHFCLENYNVLLKKKTREMEAWEWAVPMVSFCDLPLSQTGFHLSVYGDYGIGMTKAWGTRNGIAPVLYVYKESLLTSKFADLLTQAGREKADQAPWKELTDGLYDFTCFIKPYEGDLWRAGGQLTNIRFYNEREWRFVPVLSHDFYRHGMKKSDFLDTAIRRSGDNHLHEMSRIGFEPNDIKYLIVRREDEIVPLIREVERIKGKYSHDDVLLLSSRVISAEQIRGDF
jgi:hypothetical protein